MINLAIKKKRFLDIAFFIFFLFISFYGTLSIFIENVFFRGSKDVMLFFLVFLSFIWINFNKNKISNWYLFIFNFIFFSLFIFSFLSLLNGNTIVNIMYGVKITFLPMLSILIGVYLKYKNVNLIPFLVLLFISLIIAWIIQLNLGLNALLALGFEYGVHIKHFSSERLRLPSIVGTPDSYAFLLAICGLLLEMKLIKIKKYKIAFVVSVITFVFLVLATIRSALLMFIVCQLFMYIQKITFIKGKEKYLFLSITSLLVSIVLIILPKITTTSKLFDTYSLFDRFSHWKSYLPSLGSIEGWIGYGLGSVGSASVRTANLGFDSLNYAVDNQFIAIFQQVGLLGIIIFALFFITIYVALLQLNRLYTIKFENLIDIRSVRLAIAFLIVIFISGIFTNVLEIYPFNVFLFIFIGMEIAPLCYEDRLKK